MTKQPMQSGSCLLSVCSRIMQEQSSKRQEMERRVIAEQIEAERRATEKYKSDLEGRVQRERALAEAEGRIRENRENEDVNRRSVHCTRGSFCWR